ncbi:hypothetical protein GGQ85_003351 [Nitrobacter vulgaris]|jgi:hypothetical protein|uniref:hypothetical protein n=1 Tax=Nitrobacter vulgaris TaxID=29421 RepID=UPI0028651B7B|nr:hypothetical protein [Nitrobacter vulgaris]MDR6305627.1 hypothetical protein [Nitrobacter vulgaris]
MRKLALGIVAAATLLIGTIAPASAHWRHHYWGGPGIGPGVALGLVAGTLAAAAAPPIYYGPVYRPPPYYFGPPYRVVRTYPPVYPYWYGW